jgi:uncharacterized protein
MSTSILETPDGPAELVVDPADEPAAVLLLGHGAGGDVDGWDLQLLAERLPALGVTVARFRQPYRVAGRKIFSSKPGLDRAWAVALASARKSWPELPLFTGGHSAGARTACRGFAAGQTGLVLLSFPLHPPGKPDKSRAAELIAAGAPSLIVQGTKDGFGTPDEIRAVLERNGSVDGRVVELVGAGHSLGPTAATTAAQTAERERLLIWSVAGFVEAALTRPG